MHNKPALGAARNDLLQHAGYATWAEFMAARARSVDAAITEHAVRSRATWELCCLADVVHSGRNLTICAEALRDLADQLERGAA